MRLTHGNLRLSTGEQEYSHFKLYSNTGSKGKEIKQGQLKAAYPSECPLIGGTHEYLTPWKARP